MKLLTTTILGLLLCVITAKAGVENATTLCVQNVNGEVIKFALAEEPKMLFKGLYTVVQASQTKLLKFKEVDKLYFTDEDDPLAVDSETLTQEEITSRLNTVAFSNFKPNTPVRVYTTSGMIAKQGYTGADGQLNMSISDLPTGAYLIKAGSTVFKVIKR